MIKFTFLVQKLPGMSLEEFVDYHKNHHAPLFCFIPETELYVRKYVVNHPIVAEGFPKPLYDAVVEISFDSFEDFNTFFTSENYLTKVRPDEPKFFDTVNYIAMANNETIVKAGV
ncbi:EthD domain-containing protein [Pedobacter sp. MC2016-15]|uniref:EthD domain-containing protein n=1 Tax=Pedobacter sp. MC2016-15 TaxID=2994473 RepID=UPI002247749E|nr:EthD domain-containing protein [Pedobacter sp. MC2016-15]MCX2480226.1 EthD domain-containing protein [Pedobacter sp. MC2016-15]